MPLNPSEELVHHLCTKTFLSLWSIANPQVRPGKELCDILIVCDPDVILWSVKDIVLSDEDSALSHERWQRKAVEESIAQLNGAARQLSMLESVQIPGTEHAISLPPLTTRRVHRIAVALGSQGPRHDC